MLDVTITDASGIATCTAYYYVNDVLEAYEPIDSWNSDGYHLLHLLYFLENLLPGSAYEWRVALEMNGGTATIARRGIHALLEGQGLLAVPSWNGTLECEDSYTPLVLGHDLTTITDTVTALGTQTPRSITVTDIIGTITLGHDIGTITDAVDIDLTAITTNLIAENNDNLVTEDGNNLIKEGHIVTERNCSDNIGDGDRLWSLCSKSRDCVCDICKVVTKNERRICVLAFESSVPRIPSNQSLTFKQSVYSALGNRSRTAVHLESYSPLVGTSKKKILQEIQ